VHARWSAADTAPVPPAAGSRREDDHDMTTRGAEPEAAAAAAAGDCKAWLLQLKTLLRQGRAGSLKRLRRRAGGTQLPQALKRMV
jgi:hypothetical protein